ncbi:hypothetical protein EI94DRAFT_1748217 [Lactarius quietus]|nr:hypothetical protein EI94DRAFT_1748217 [Lactarius quietus]
MSRAPLENINMTEANTGPDPGDHQYPPRSASNQESQSESNFFDSSGPIFSMYLQMAEEEDKKMAESWKADAEGILVFTGLFSAAVATLISVSIQDVRQNPQDTSNFYLANIYQAIADPNRPNISNSLPPSPPPFSPPKYAVWVNGLSFLSLVISLTCALLATLLQQWARRYLQATQTRYSLHKRARIRSFFFEGVEISPIRFAVEALPTLVHISLFLFFAGLVVFLRNVNLTIFKFVLSWVSVCTYAYVLITLVPIIHHNSPYYTPLTGLAENCIFASLLAFLLDFAILHAFLIFLSRYFRCHRLVCSSDRMFKWVLQVLQKTLLTPEQAALKSSSRIDTRALMWTFDRLDEDHEIERFFSGLPGFHNSKVLKEPFGSLSDEKKLQLLAAIIGFLDRTFSSDLLSDEVKRHRENICANAIDLVDTPTAFLEIMRALASEAGLGPLQSTETLRFVRRWGNRKGVDTTAVQAIFSIVVARVQQHDDSWFNLASDELGIPETVLREYAACGDSLSLAILIYLTRQQLIHSRYRFWPSKAISNVLGVASKFNVQDTSPELQHKFCTLWNQVALVRNAQNGNDWGTAGHILRRIWNIYISLHQGTDSAPTRFSSSTVDGDQVLWEPISYPFCNVGVHIQDNSAFTTSAGTILHDNHAQSPPFLTNPPDQVNENPTSLPSLDISYPSYQIIKSILAPMKSPRQSISTLIQKIAASSIITMPYPTPEASTSAPPLPSASPPAAVSLHHNEDTLTPSNLPDPQPSASGPYLDNILPTVTVTSVVSTPLGPTSAPDSGPAAKNSGSSRRDQHVLDPPSVNRTIDPNTSATLDISPQSQPLSSVTDSEMDVAGRSTREPNAGHTKDDPPDRSRYRYDMV